MWLNFSRSLLNKLKKYGTAGREGYQTGEVAIKVHCQVGRML